jgi:cell division protein ZapA
MIIHKKNTPAENSYTFEIMGDEYMVKGTDQPEVMETIIHYLESVINNISGSNPKLVKSQVAVLAALKIADELYKLRQEYERLEQKKGKVDK